jgi:Uma2 family endonuclease
MQNAWLEGPTKIMPRSPRASETACALVERIVDYHSAGVKLVWVVYPVARVFRVHRPDHTVAELVDGDTLTGESVLPGFVAKISDLLPPKPTV